jgi:hypothetical protein
MKSCVLVMGAVDDERAEALALLPCISCFRLAWVCREAVWVVLVFEMCCRVEMSPPKT